MTGIRGLSNIVGMTTQAEDKLADATDCLRAITTTLVERHDDSFALSQAKADIRAEIGVDVWYRAQAILAMNEKLDIVDEYGKQLAALQEMGDVARERLDRAECNCIHDRIHDHQRDPSLHWATCPVYREARA